MRRVLGSGVIPRSSGIDYSQVCYCRSTFPLLICHKRNDVGVLANPAKGWGQQGSASGELALLRFRQDPGDGPHVSIVYLRPASVLGR